MYKSKEIVVLNVSLFPFSLGFFFSFTTNTALYFFPLHRRFLSEIDSHNPLQFLPRKGSTSSQSSRRTISFEDTPSSPVLVIRTRTQARMVQDSLEKSQKANDDLFEL